MQGHSDQCPPSARREGVQRLPQMVGLQHERGGRRIRVGTGLRKAWRIQPRRAYSFTFPRNTPNESAGNDAGPVSRMLHTPLMTDCASTNSP